jgi:hypothetical protein
MLTCSWLVSLVVLLDGDAHTTSLDWFPSVIPSIAMPTQWTPWLWCPPMYEYAWLVSILNCDAHLCLAVIPSFIPQIVNYALHTYLTDIRCVNTRFQSPPTPMLIILCLLLLRSDYFPMIQFHEPRSDWSRCLSISGAAPGWPGFSLAEI